MNILDKRFVYTPAAQTDIRKTFERARQQLQIKNILKTSFPEIYFPIPESIDEIEIAEGYRLMHQDVEQEYPWGN
jgi:hypothetical protein